tara:strand:+ start:1447 stop:1611 length:165 start_codon:yes stop_codon:yes gene_type:complete
MQKNTEEKILKQLVVIADLLNKAIQMFKEQQQADIENRLSKAEKEWLLATDKKK